MEEAPTIERVVASQGISISDTAKILTSYLSKVNHHHHQSINFNETSKDDNTNLDYDEDANNKSPIRKSKQEREEDALIAQMDQLANSKSSVISDDIYERLQQITQSITAEVEGRTISACGLDKNKEQNEGSDDNVNDTTDHVANDFQAGQLEKHTKQQQEVQVQQQQTNTTPKSHREKKKAKKDKKAAKRAKKEAKRKAKEMEEDESITTDIPLHRKKKIY